MNRETSLAAQLRKLEAPQTEQLRESKVRASFLYDKKEALSIDKDTHFIIATAGFRQICLIDSSFAAFEDLFSIANKDLDRSVKSREENDHLNTLIQKFLYQVVSPYFLLSHVHKMLEWLVYRYAVHQYNLDDLIMAVLPYHETKLFPRVVQLIPKIDKPNNKWHWLVNVKKHDVPMPKVSMISHFKSSSATLKSLIELVELVAKHNKVPVIISFLTSIIVHLLEDDFIHQANFSDVYFPSILSYILHGAKSSNRSLVQSSYIILSQLVTRATIMDSKLEEILSKMAKYLASNPDPENRKNFLLALLIAYEFQELEKIPPRVANVLDLDNFIELSTQIQSKFFLTALLTSYINRCDEDDEYMKCMKIVDNLRLPSYTISKVLEAAGKKSAESSVRSKLSNIVQILERRFPTEFDAATNKGNIKGLGDLIISPFYAKLNDKNLNVFVSLANANEAIRSHSADHIVKNYKEILKCTDEHTRQCISEALVNTYRETNPLVLIQLLSCRELFAKIVPLTDLIEYGKKLLPRCDETIRKVKDDKAAHDDWMAIRRSCFNLVSNLDFKNEYQFWDLFVDYFLPLDATGLSLFSVIFETDIEKTNRKLFDWSKSIYTEDLISSMDKKDFGLSIEIVTKRIAQYINKNPNSPLLDVLNQPGHDNYRKQVLGLCILFHLLSFQAGNYETFNKLALICISILNKLLDPTHVKFKRTEDENNLNGIRDFINCSAKNLTRGRVTSSMVHLFVSRIISFKQLPPLKPWIWHLETPDTNHIHGLFDFLCHQSNSVKLQAIPVFQTLLQSFLHEIDSLCPKFLVGLWTKTDSPLVQARALHIASRLYVKDDFDEIELISLCIALQSPHDAVRSAAVKLLDLESKSDSVISSLKQFKELIEGDARETGIAIANYWEKNDPDESKKTPFSFKNIEEKYLSTTNTYKLDRYIPAAIKVHLANLLRDYKSTACLKLFMSFLVTKPSNPHEKRLTFLCGRKIIEMLPHLEDNQDFTIHRSHLNRLFADDELRPQLIDLFDNSYVKQLNNEAKMLIIDCLLAVIQTRNENSCRRKLRKFLTDGDLVSLLIDKLIEGDLLDEEESAKSGSVSQVKRPRMDKQFILEQDSVTWKRIVIILEIFASKETFTEPESLMETVFKLLKENLLSEEQSSSEYFRSLLLVILSNCLNQEGIELDNFELSYILESLRHARLRETRMQALTIINRVSHHLKDDILRNIITIFGFIGNDMVKCDDQFTHKILDDTMDTIIPGLVMTSPDASKKIVETFTDAFNDIPLHRRLYLFQKLTTLLGEEKLLWFIAYKLIRRSHDVEESRKFISEFVSALVSGFDAVTQMTTINELMSSCNKILEEGFFEALGEAQRFPETTRSDFVKEVISTIYLIVSSEDYVSAIARSKWSDMEDLFNQLFEVNLILVDRSIKNDKSNRIASRLTRELLRVLEKVNTLLPGPEFISVIHRLFESKALVVRRKALELLNARLTANTLKKSEIFMLRDFIQSIVNIILGLRENRSDLQIVTSQTGLMSIKILSRLLQGDSDSIDLLNSALKSIVSLYEGRKEITTNNNLLASMILCISQLATCLQDDCLPLIPSVMSITLATLNETSEVILLSCLTALNKLTKHFGNYLSSNIVDLVKSICTLDKNLNITGMAVRVDKVVSNLASYVPVRILLQGLEDAYEQLSNPDHLYVCLSILSRSLVNCDKTDIEPNLSSLQNFALKLLNYRSTHCDLYPINTLTKVEDKGLEAITSFVPKLSEPNFRTFFFKVYDWIRANDSVDYQRTLTFYRLTNRLADKLKVLFSKIAAPCIVINCMKQLKTFNLNNSEGIFKSSSDSATKYQQLGHLIILNTLTTLSKSFQHDTGSAFAANSKKLYPLILDQIVNDFGSDNDYTQRIDDGVIPCLCHMVRAVNDHTIIKDMNYQLLLKTRENSAKVRQQALHVLHQLILSMTEEYTPYIPEAIPFLAELHEDDSDTIQKLLLIVFSDIEKIFGEPINSYF